MNSLIIKANYTNTWGANAELNVYGNIVVCFPRSQKKLKMLQTHQINQASNINKDCYRVIKGMCVKISDLHFIASTICSQQAQRVIITITIISKVLKGAPPFSLLLSVTPYYWFKWLFYFFGGIYSRFVFL